MERLARLRLLRTARILAAAAALVAAHVAAGKVLLTPEEALKLAFPGATITRHTAFLTKAQQEAARKLSGDEEAPSALATYYTGVKDGKLLGTGYLDTHTVRTMPETVLIVVDPAGAIARIEVLSFSEPEEYLPKAHWYEQFQGKALDDELSLKRAIRPVTGATLTARATTEAARRVLALHKVLQEAPKP